MDSKIALEKMKQLLCDISAKNESLNNDNNDLNIKIISLIKLLKSKDNQINILNKNILKKNLKLILYKKYLAQNKILKNTFNIFKHNTKNNNDIKEKEEEKFIYSNENDIYFPGKNKLDYKEVGIGDFKINQKFYVRKVACLTLFKRRKNIINDDEKENNGNINTKYNYKFRNIEQQYEVNNICIKSNRNKSKEKQNFDCSAFNLEIKRNNKLKIFDNKLLKSENTINNCSLLSERKNIESMELIIEQKEKDIKILENKCNENEIEKKELEKEIINVKQDLLISQNTLNEYINKYNYLNNKIEEKRYEIVIDKKNKNYLSIKSSKKKKNYEIYKENDITIIPFNESKNDKKGEFIYYKNESFDILSNKNKKIVLKKYNFNLNIFNNKNHIININKTNLIISKENNINISCEKSDKEKSKKDKEYEIIEPLKYDIFKKNNKINKSFDILLSNSFSFNIIHNQNKKEKLIKISKSFHFDIINEKKEEKIFEISNTFSFDIINIKQEKEKEESIENGNQNLQLNNNDKYEKKILSFKLMVFDSKIKNILYINPKVKFFVKLIFYYFQNKITDSFKMFRNLLINLKLKILLKNKINGPSGLYFLKYYLIKFKSNSLFLSLLQNKNELVKNIETNNKLNSQISLFQETFKKYEESNLKEKSEKDTTISRQKSIINELNKEISKIKGNYEKMKLEAKDNASELITTSNESNKQKKIIEKLNIEIKTLQDEKASCENQIKNQQELIKNLNEKIKKDQFEYEQNEIDVNTQIEKLKVQFDEYEKSIKKLNNQNMNLKTENEKLKKNNENLNNNKEELLSIIQESKNYELENESLISLNKELKNNNEDLNIKYKNLKKEFDNLKSMSEESKNELTKAMNEMELYSELLQTLEMKVKDAESKKLNAESERDKAINDVREIRQRYINIMGEKYA